MYGAEVTAREPVRNVHPEYARAPAAEAGRLLSVRHFAEISGFARLRPKAGLPRMRSNAGSVIMYKEKANEAKPALTETNPTF